ncbi:hypoxia-inducible factor 1-alpha-like [Pecten maximus]|uniref:hypoxia-inducible factor 1-alpha-like n=1 Tax=Pecten maximus TaxID=6579 RepID=UPI00145869DF|nr:hypoxia-inducible factor 1-alpha-like [Pecten maximus]XP_033742791.1 hypoxia-inducible factor 1-alpha-like [Pecten maximus]
MSDADSPDGGRDKKKSKHHEDNDTTKRQYRKVGEKLRRDKLKSYLSVLAQEIPWISDANHKVDRSQILKLTVNYLKFHHGVKEKKIALQKWKPNFLSSDTLRQCLSEATGGFVMVVSHTGTVVFVSESISCILGHSPVNVIGLPISNILHEDDCETFSRQFQMADENAFICESLPSDQERVQINTFKSNHRSFLVRMQILLKNSNILQYETVHFLGKISSEDTKTGDKKVKTSDQHNIWLVAVGRLVRDRVIHELSVMGLDKLEWCSQHSMDGTVLFTDQRVSQCLGLFSGESTGHSCYKYIIPEDIQAVSISHMKIMTDNEVPQTIFRLKIPNQDTKYIVSRSVVVRDKWTKEAKFISSINIIIDKTEGDQLLEEQQKKVDTLIAVTKQLSLQKDNSEVPAQKDDMADRNCNNSEIACDCGTSESPVGNVKNFESIESSAHVRPRQFGTPLLKSLLVSDLVSSSNIHCTCTTETCSETSPVSSGSHSINSGCSHSINRNACSQSTGSSESKSGSPQIFGNEDSPTASSGGSLDVTNGEGSPYLYDEDTNCHSLSNDRPLVKDHKNIVTGSINKELISTTEEEPSCDEKIPAICSIQRVRNWTDTLTEVEMDISRSTDLSDSRDAYSSQSNLTLQQSLSDTSSASLDGLDRYCPNSDPTNIELSPSVQSKLSHDQSSPVSNSRSFQPSGRFHEISSVQTSSVHNLNSFNMLYTTLPCTVDSNLTFQSSLPGSQSSNQSSVLYSHSEQLPLHVPFDSHVSDDLSVTPEQASYAESRQSFDQTCQPCQALPSVSFAKAYPEKPSIKCCADQSNVPSRWSISKDSKEIQNQENTTLSVLLSSPTLDHQQSLNSQSKSAQHDQYNQLHFEQASHTYNDINLLSAVQSSVSYDYSGNGDDHLSKWPMFKQQHPQGQLGLNQSRCEQQNIEHGQICRSEKGAISGCRQSITSCKGTACSSELDEIQKDNFPLVPEKEFKTRDSRQKEVLCASANESTQDFRKKECNAYFKLAGQLRAKHKQIRKSLVSQESVLDQVQENLSLVTDAQTGNGQNGTTLNQNVFNLKAAIREQRMQLSDLEDEFISRISDRK